MKGDHCVRLTSGMVELPRFAATYPKSFGAGWTLPQDVNCSFADMLIAVCLSSEEELCAGKAWLVKRLMRKYKVDKTCMAKLLVYTLVFIEGKQAQQSIQMLLPLLSNKNIQSMALAAIKHQAFHKDELVDAAAKA